MITVTILPVLKDNYAYLLQSEDGVTAVIDPGEAEPISKHLESHGLNLDFILNTHHHGDHTAGNAALKDKYGSKIFGPEHERSKIPAQDFGLSEKDSFFLGKERMQVLETPGHTAGSICFYFPESGILFTGDTLFLMGCGRLFEGTPEQMFHSLHKILALPDETLIYCGHEYTLEATDFCLSIEPDNAALKKRQAEVRILDQQKKPTVPATLRIEKETNVFLRAKNVEKFSEYRLKRNNF